MHFNLLVKNNDYLCLYQYTNQSHYLKLFLNRLNECAYNSNF